MIEIVCQSVLPHAADEGISFALFAYLASSAFPSASIPQPFSMQNFLRNMAGPHGNPLGALGQGAGGLVVTKTAEQWLANPGGALVLPCAPPFALYLYSCCMCRLCDNYCLARTMASIHVYLSPQHAGGWRDPVLQELLGESHPAAVVTMTYLDKTRTQLFEDYGLPEVGCSDPRHNVLGCRVSCRRY